MEQPGSESEGEFSRNNLKARMKLADKITRMNALATSAASSTAAGSTPKLSDAQRAQSQQLAMLFTAQIQQSMLASLSMLGSDEEGTTEGSGGDEGDADASRPEVKTLQGGAA